MERTGRGLVPGRGGGESDYPSSQDSRSLISQIISFKWVGRNDLLGKLIGKAVGNSPSYP